MVVEKKNSQKDFSSIQNSAEQFIDRLIESRKAQANSNKITLTQHEKNKLRDLKNKYLGKRIFILGNGPSLNKTDLSLLKNEYTFFTNKAYLLYKKIDWCPTFYTATDWRVVPDIYSSINALRGSLFFFEKRFMDLLRDGEDVMWYTHNIGSGDEKLFSYNIENGVRGAGSVVGSCIQIAFHLGFREIYLIGCDLGYKVQDSVKQEGEDVFGTGVKLNLTSTLDDDINHFDKSYFGKGSKWHDPNVKRMIQGHEQCKTGVNNAGGKIFNATIGGELEVFKRVNYYSLFSKSANEEKSITSEFNKNFVKEGFCNSDDYLLGPFLRTEQKHIEEIDIIFTESNGKVGTMVDVGGHHGSSSLKFLRLGWNSIIFEPDPDNRKYLMANIRRLKDASDTFGKVVVDKRAVSNKISNMNFYKSPESSGVSGLNKFLPSHTSSYKVETITLTKALEQYKIESVDFLKIDVEGYDYFVLKSFPWDTEIPEFILIEFEDKKTKNLGYDTKDMASFLSEMGYKIFISEWHPIVKYGMRHQWKGLKKYNIETQFEPNSWGNLIATKKTLDDERVCSLAYSLISSHEISDDISSKFIFYCDGSELDKLVTIKDFKNEACKLFDLNLLAPTNKKMFDFQLVSKKSFVLNMEISVNENIFFKKEFKINEGKVHKFSLPSFSAGLFLNVSCSKK